MTTHGPSNLESRALGVMPAVPNELRDQLNAAEVSGPSAEQLERLARRMGPLVGVEFGALLPAALPQGRAPADVGAGAVTSDGGASAVKTGLGKLWTATGAKLFVGACVMGAGVWIASLAAVPTQPAAVSSRPVAPRAASAARAVPEPAAVPAPATPEPAVVAAPEVQSAPHAAKRAAAPAAAPDELSLIQRAQALRGQTGPMLAVLAQHARLYPTGMLSQEREVLAIEALVSAGRMTEARARAARLEAKHPNSAHLARVHALLEKGAGK